MATELRRKLLAVLLAAASLALQLAGHLTSAMDVGDIETQTQTHETSYHHKSVGGRSLQTNGSKTRAQVLSKLCLWPLMLLTGTSSNASSLSDAVIAAVIAPRFLLTMTDWIAAAEGGLSVAVAAGETIPVKQVWLESDFNPSSGIPGGDYSNNSSVFAVVELERDAPFDVGLSASLPAPENVLEVVYVDPFLLSTGGELQSLPGVVTPNGECALSSPSESTAVGSSGVFCVQSVLPHVSASETQEPYKMAFATTLSGQVIGIASSRNSGNHYEIDGSQAGFQSFIHFGSVPYKQFLDQVTTNALNWGNQKSTQDATSPVPAITAPAPAALLPDTLTRVSFFENGVELDCGGIQIAKLYILTSASCVLSHRITSVSFNNSGGATASSQNVQVAKQIVHPKFQSTNRTAGFDVAILTAPSPENPSPSVVLNPRVVPTFTALDRLQLGGSGQLQSVELLPRDQCKTLQQQKPPVPTSETTNATEAWTTWCIETRSGNRRGLSSSDQATNAALLMRSADSTGYYHLTGLQPDASSSDQFVRISDVVAFINTQSVGHKWAVSPELKESVLTPTSAPTPGPRPTPITAALSSATPMTALPQNSKSYVVGLRAERDGASFCGGVLITASYVLTAASCVSDDVVSWVSIGAFEETIRVTPNSIVLHPKFQTPYMPSNNAAILELEYPSYARPIGVDPSADFEDGTAATVMGLSTKRVSVPVWSKRKCRTTLPEVDDSTLCAGGEPGKDACTGDAGSPLTIQRGSSGEEYLIGLVSAGYGCDQTGVPGLYTRVESLLDFIAANTAETRPGASEIASGAGDTSPVNSSGSSATITNPKPNEERANNSEQLGALSPVIQDKVVSIFIGTVGSNSEEVQELKDRVLAGSSTVVLYSTGDLAGLLKVVETHDALPLNKRQDRFGTATGSSNSVEANRQGCDS